MSQSVDETQQLVVRATSGDRVALGDLLERYRDQLFRIVAIRMDRRLQSRVDANDVLQDAFIEATQRFEDYSQDPRMPFFLWLRFITLQKLMQLHRFHLGTQGRSARREISIYDSSIPQATSAVLAAQLLGSLTSPTQAVVRSEEKKNLENALNEMDEIDREVLVLRHFEKLSVADAAQILGLTESGASSRYFRALDKLKKLL